MSSFDFASKAIEDEYETVAAMIHLYCGKKHKTACELCEECQDLLEYAGARLEQCPQYESKPPCRHCKIHCYRDDYREKIRGVMQFSGPRMILNHPLKALKHMLSK